MFKSEPKSKKVKKLAKQTGREIDKEKRGINRDVRDFERQEAKLLKEIADAAKKGDEMKARNLAKQLVRLRKAKNNISNSVATLDGVKIQAKTMAANMIVADSLGKATKVMKKINNNVKTEEIAKRAKEYEMEMEKANITQEIMDDALAAAFDDEGAEEETDEMVNKVLDEVGIQNMAGLESAPMGSVKVANKDATAEADAEEDADADEVEQQV